MPTRKETEEKMAAGFLPDDNTQQDFRAAIALEYIAFYMGRIDKNLARLAHAVERFPRPRP